MHCSRQRQGSGSGAQALRIFWPGGNQHVFTPTTGCARLPRPSQGRARGVLTRRARVRLQAAGERKQGSLPIPPPRCSDEDSGELAAAAARQRRRRSVAPGSAQKRYGSWFEGDDRELEHTLHEYNRGAPASPRMTRAQRRKSLAVDRSLALDPGLARAALGEAAGDAQQQQQQQGKVTGGARRKSMAAAQQVGRGPRGLAGQRGTLPCLHLLLCSA